MFIKNEDVRGYWIGEQELICPECVADELTGLTAKDVLIDSEMDDEDLYFCDRCGERIDKA